MTSNSRRSPARIPTISASCEGIETARLLPTRRTFVVSLPEPEHPIPGTLKLQLAPCLDAKHRNEMSGEFMAQNIWGPIAVEGPAS